MENGITLAKEIDSSIIFALVKHLWIHGTDYDIISSSIMQTDAKTVMETLSYKTVIFSETDGSCYIKLIFCILFVK